MIQWDPQTQDHLNKIKAAIDEMETQVRQSGQTMLAIIDMNAGATIRSINDNYNEVVAPSLRTTLESFRSFVNATEQRYLAAQQQDRENTMH